MSASKILFYLGVSFIGGIFLNSIIEVHQLLMLIFLILGIFLISVPPFSKKAGLVVVGFCFLFLVTGIWRHQVAILKIENNELKNYVNQRETVTLIGVVDTEPDVREKTTKLRIKVKDSDERVLITKWHYPQYEYGDKLKIRGYLEEAEIFEGFNYKDYLAREGIFALMYQPEIELIEKDQGSPFQKFLFLLKNKLKESLNKVISLPQSALLEALLWGDEGNIPKVWKDKLNLTGTRHIAAVSGMNITILTFLLSDLLLILGFWRNQSFYFSIILIFLYILIIGAPISAVRAGIMAGLFLTAQYFGRISAAPRIILFAATIILIFNPLLLISDVGFQLSFLAIMGLVYLQPTFSSSFFKKIPNFLQLRFNLSATLSAQIFTFPILIYNFGQISIVSLITNILILPFLPAATILGFAFSFLGMISETLGQVLSWPAWLLLTYMIKIIDFFSKLPWASLTFNNIHWLWLFISYLILVSLTLRLQEKQKLKFLQY